MSEMSDAYLELQQAFAEELGEPQRVKIGSKEYDALISEVTFEEIEVAGGKGQNGGFRATVGKDVHPKEPEQGEAISARGQTVEILSVVNTNGVTWTMVCGDPSIE